MADFARGQLLVELRDARHLNQEDAAHEIGVSTKSLRAWEHGGKIRWPNAERVGAFYGIDPERLVSRTEDGASREPTPDLAATFNGTMPADLHEQLADLQRKVDAIVEALGIEDTADVHPLQQINDLAAALPELLARGDGTAGAKKRRPGAR